MPSRSRSSTSARTRPPAATALRLADRAARGALTRELCRRSLWGTLPARPARRPDDVRRLAFTVDLDYQADTDALPALVELLRRHDARMTVFAVGALVDACPGPYEQALAAGHEIANHSMTHPDNPVLDPDREFWHLSAEEMAAQVGDTQDLLERRLGLRPRGFRTPHFKDAHRLTGVLRRFPEIRYVSSALATRTPSGGEPYLAPTRTTAGEAFSHLLPTGDGDPDGLLQIPLTACPAHRWSPFCSWHGIRAGAVPGSGAGMHPLPEWQALWRSMLERAEPDGLAVVYLDPHDLVRDEETTAAVSAMLAHAVAAGWELTTLDDVERAYRPLQRAAA
ncbi:polysaccharide deacetylase family protein [Pseudokineococcus sp. 1T1Z-3]|uniref:polysaccharide deacetylase family protein n=1 Tax=Pseudokineococcus sp. 1T1Z-3 TaxID=3132745 RepID=UPI00309F0132